jgi:hypothetical protein
VAANSAAEAALNEPQATTNHDRRENRGEVSSSTFFFFATGFFIAAVVVFPDKLTPSAGFTASRPGALSGAGGFKSSTMTLFSVFKEIKA